MGMELGLEKTRSLLDTVGNPHRAYRTLLISGTNGKSSVASILANILRHAGYRVGLYTSPHILFPEERVRVNGQPIPRPALADAIQELRAVVERLRRRGGIRSRPTYFELFTVLACSYFRQQRVQFGIFEVGLGGKYDATNTVDPSVSVITNIDYDHTQILGQTLTEIAGEKVGIGRCGVPLVSNAFHPEAQEAIQRYCLHSDIPVVDVGRTSRIEKKRDGWRLSTGRAEYPGIRPCLKGAHQLENLATAIRAIEELQQVVPDMVDLSNEQMGRSINSTRPPAPLGCFSPFRGDLKAGSS